MPLMTLTDAVQAGLTGKAMYAASLLPRRCEHSACEEDATSVVDIDGEYLCLCAQCKEWVLYGGIT